MFKEDLPKFLGSTPILFLDFDGPMHPYDVDHIRKKGVILNTKGHTLFENTPILESIIAKYPDLKIVLSTSWVRVLGYSRALKRLSPLIKERVIGATWHSSFKYFVDSSPYASGFGVDYFSRITRFQQIMQYVDRHGLSNWIAIDDDNIGWNPDFADNLVKCDNMLGLSELRCQLELEAKLNLLFKKT